ncbi:MAG: hypothetical protein C0404_06675 [Verrucomicrobia bacterium]|nr:hypothetical protein [Verrucomicrobiota bacterium]
MMNNFMSWSLYLGRVAGISIRLHWILLIFWAFDLVSILQAGYPVWIWPMSILISFGCILLHEFGHCFAARAVGGHADHILLWPLGGLAYCDSPGHWRAKFLVSAGGPLVTLTLIALALTVSFAVPGLSRDTVGYPLRYAYAILIDWQIWLLVFNLIPIYPMDGGRMCHAALWRILQKTSRSYDAHSRAATATMWITRVTAAIGIVFSFWMANAMMALIFAWCIMNSGAVFNEAEDAGGIFGYGSSGWTAAPGRGISDWPAREPWWRRWLRRMKNKLRRSRAPIRFPVSEERERQRMDEILDKISRSGINSISSEESQFMQEVSRRWSKKKT